VPANPEMPEMKLHLANREILNIRDGVGLRVRCLRGVLCITQANDSDDIVIHEGQSFTLDRRGVALVSAPVGPADIAIAIATEPAAVDRARSAENRRIAARAA
jgi:Protein of unknown function (DUF2917)